MNIVSAMDRIFIQHSKELIHIFNLIVPYRKALICLNMFKSWQSIRNIYNITTPIPSICTLSPSRCTWNSSQTKSQQIVFAKRQLVFNCHKYTDNSCIIYVSNFLSFLSIFLHGYLLICNRCCFLW